jgi:CubicO group peptidase (beta-lactamase class C family)
MVGARMVGVRILGETASRPRPDPVSMAGFPPQPGSLVTLANWHEPQSVRWSFQHMREIIPSQSIPAAENPAPRFPSSLHPTAGGQLDSVGLIRLDGSSANVDDVLGDTCTDAVMILHDAHVVTERYEAGMSASSRHLLMSVSKSIVGCVAGVLIQQGLLDPDAAASRYVPEVGHSGYAGATIRDLLDMRTGVAFRETYTDLDAEVRVMERSIGWRPARDGDPLGAYAYLASLATAGPHGGDFTYRSADTDMLGWVCERAAGTRMADLVSTLIWQPLGAEYDAEITCDPLGCAIHDGGISTTLRDLARFGQMLLDDGRVGDQQIVPQAWLRDSRNPSPEIRDAFARSDNEPVLPGGWYHNQFWFFRAHGTDIQLCLGIHGQMLYVDHSTRTVAAKLSSWPDPQNTSHLIDTLRAFGAVSAHLTQPTRK